MARMAYCGPRGIPLSTFLDWPQSDQDAALAWQSHEARRCPGCGTHPDDGDRHFHVNVCPTCVQLSHAREGDATEVRGAHLVTADGSRGTCDRCLSEVRANQPPRR